jgi:hypothetical protein
MARRVAESRLIPGIDTPAAAFTLMMLCQAEGLHPGQALRRFHIINGRASMRADAIQAEFQRLGGVVYWERSDDLNCTARFVHPIHAPDPGQKIEWTYERAKRARLTNNPAWQSYPRNMLRARVISEGVRMILPGVLVGIYTPEEVSDFGPETTGQTVEVQIVPSEEPASPSAPAPALGGQKVQVDTIDPRAIEITPAILPADVMAACYTSDHQRDQLNRLREELAISDEKWGATLAKRNVKTIMHLSMIEAQTLIDRMTIALAERQEAEAQAAPAQADDIAGEIQRNIIGAKPVQTEETVEPATPSDDFIIPDGERISTATEKLKRTRKTKEVPEPATS